MMAYIVLFSTQRSKYNYDVIVTISVVFSWLILRENNLNFFVLKIKKYKKEKFRNFDLVFLFRLSEYIN